MGFHPKTHPGWIPPEDTPRLDSISRHTQVGFHQRTHPGWIPSEDTQVGFHLKTCLVGFHPKTRPGWIPSEGTPRLDSIRRHIQVGFHQKTHPGPGSILKLFEQLHAQDNLHPNSYQRAFAIKRVIISSSHLSCKPSTIMYLAHVLFNYFKNNRLTNTPKHFHRFLIRQR